MVHVSGIALSLHCTVDRDDLLYPRSFRSPANKCPRPSGIYHPQSSKKHLNSIIHFTCNGSSSIVRNTTRLDVIKKKERKKEPASQKIQKRWVYATYQLASKYPPRHYRTRPTHSSVVRIILPPLPLSLRRTDEKVFPSRTRLDKV